MKFKVKNRVFYIDDKYVEYSPYLSTLVNTQVGVEKDKGIPIVTQVDIPTFIAYIRFLEGKDFRFNHHIERFFDYMGHINAMQYPLDYWQVKLQDNWIRDNFYRLELYKDPYYGLVDITHMSKFNLDYVADSQCLERLQDAYIAGGFALLMVDGVKRTRNVDIDIFTVDRKHVTNFMKHSLTLTGLRVQASNNAVTIKISDKSFPFIRVIEGEENIHAVVNDIQIILREYRCPSEIIHGFDVDCCGVLFDVKNRKLYATKRALYAINNRVNWFDPERSSPSYAYRLAKYTINGGYKIKLPRFEELQIDEDYKDSFEDTMYNLIRQDSEFADELFDGTLDEVFGMDSFQTEGDIEDELLDVAQRFVSDKKIQKSHVPIILGGYVP